MRAFQYTPRQAEFLAYVALHGGYFLRRHYMAFTGHGHGLATVRFLKRLVERKHARRLPFGEHGHVYHLCARPIYNACGLEKRRWGRDGSWQRVVETLMTLDVVLAHRNAQFLVTDEDKASVLAEAGLDAGLWPVMRRGRAPGAAPSEDPPRFGHRPWYVDEEGQRLCLLYVESGTTLTTFRSFLVAHAFLLRSVPSGVTYVSQWMPTARVRDLFSRVVRDEAAMPAQMSADFLLYCKVRRAWELNSLGPVSVAQIRRFREVRPRFTNRHHEDLFQRWVANSQGSGEQPGVSIPPSIDWVLHVQQAEHFYGGIPTHRRGKAG
jgi:hypothetical protein